MFPVMVTASPSFNKGVVLCCINKCGIIIMHITCSGVGLVLFVALRVGAGESNRSSSSLSNSPDDLGALLFGF